MNCPHTHLSLTPIGYTCDACQSFTLAAPHLASLLAGDGESHSDYSARIDAMPITGLRALAEADHAR